MWDGHLRNHLQPISYRAQRLVYIPSPRPSGIKAITGDANSPDRRQRPSRRRPALVPSLEAGQPCRLAASTRDEPGPLVSILSSLITDSTCARIADELDHIRECLLPTSSPVGTDMLLWMLAAATATSAVVMTNSSCTLTRGACHAVAA